MTGVRNVPVRGFRREAVGTLNLLEAARRGCPESSFIHMSTSKVYGDAPNRLDLVKKKFDIAWYYGDYWTNCYFMTLNRTPFGMRLISGRRLENEFIRGFECRTPQGTTFGQQQWPV